MRSPALLAIGCLLLVDIAPRMAGACSPPPANESHVLDPAHASDATPPGAVTVSDVTVYHDPPGDDDAGGCSNENECHYSPSRVNLVPRATDDATPAEKIGYQLRVVSGTAPEHIQIPEEAVRPLEYTDSLELRFFDHTDAFAFDLEVRAVDLNGNLGPPTIVRVEDPGLR